jgi:hypothetical protein
MPGERISSTHGTARSTNPETGASNATTYAMYHPAAALRQGSLKETMLVDMAGLPEILIQSRERRALANADAVVVPALSPATPEPALIAPAMAPVAPAMALMAPEPVQLAPEAPTSPAQREPIAMVAPAPTAGEPQLELFGR